VRGHTWLITEHGDWREENVKDGSINLINITCPSAAPRFFNNNARRSSEDMEMGTIHIAVLGEINFIEFRYENNGRRPRYQHDST
jgi:hypothetical protein